MISTSVEDLVKQLYRLGLVQRDIARHALQHLGSQGFTALAIIEMHGPARTSDVAQRLSVDLSVASRQISALLKAGYVRREADPGDRRAQLLSSTPLGRKVLKESHGRMVEAFDRVLADWTDEDISTLSSSLERLREDFARAAAADAAGSQELPA